MKDRLGALLVLIILAGAAYWLLQRNQLPEPTAGELQLKGQVARGPGLDCWILNANTGEKFQFVGSNLGELKTVGARVTLIANPLPDRESDCFNGRVISVVAFVIDEKPNFRQR